MGERNVALREYFTYLLTLLSLVLYTCMCWYIVGSLKQVSEKSAADKRHHCIPTPISSLRNLGRTHSRANPCIAMRFN